MQNPISPYDPAPLDRIIDDWPEMKARPRRWEGGLFVSNEAYRGKGALLAPDDDRQRTVTAAYQAPVEIPEGGLRLHFGYRTLLPGQRFLVSLNHLDGGGRWILPGSCPAWISRPTTGPWNWPSIAITSTPSGSAYRVWAADRSMRSRSPCFWATRTARPSIGPLSKGTAARSRSTCAGGVGWTRPTSTGSTSRARGSTPSS